MPNKRPHSHESGPGALDGDETMIGPGAIGAEPVGLIDTPPSDQKSYSQGQLVRRRFFRHKAAMTSVIILLFIVILAFTSIGFGPIPGWWDKSYAMSAQVIDGGRPTLQLWPFSLGEHPFGQDNTGKDYFALVMRGTQRSLIIAFVVGIVSTFIGTVVGALAGYFRGWVEAILMRVTDLFIIMPLLVLAAVLGRIASGGKGGIWTLALMLGFVTWTGRSEEHTSELQSRGHLVCRLLLEKKNATRVTARSE